MANEQQQPQSSSDADPADAILDQYLGVSDDEDTPKVPRKAAQSGDPEKQPPEPEEPEDDEPEDGEEEDDTTHEDDAEGEEEDQSEDEQGRFVGKDGRVKLPDGSTTTVAELIRGNLREADYTRKTQETGALFQELQARQADYAQQDQIVSFAIDIMAGAMPPEPDPSLLEPGEGNDPIGYTNQKLRWEAAAQQLQAMQAAKQQMAERNNAIQGTLMKRYALEQKDKLLAYKPELKEKAKLEAFNKNILWTLRHYGKGAEDLAQVYDADIIKMLDDLYQFRKLVSARKKARHKTAGMPVLAPGTRQSPSGQKARIQSKDWEQLRKTGGRGQGEAALDRILDNLL